MRSSQYRGRFFGSRLGLLLLESFDQCKVIVLVFFRLLVGMFGGFITMFVGGSVFNFVGNNRVHKGKETTLGLFTTHYYINIKIINMWRSLLK
jgi:hypothetical protein